MKFHKVSDATKLNLVRLTQWSTDTDQERKYLESENTRVMQDPTRKTMFVKYEKENGNVNYHYIGMIALFVNDIAGTGNNTKGPQVRELSRSKKFKSVRHLAETLFAKNQNLTLDVFQAVMKSEYPRSVGASTLKCYSTFCWYRHHLVHKQNFKCIEKPSWAKWRIE